MTVWSTGDVKHAETALSRVNAQNLLWNFQINAMGPVLVSKVMLYYSAAPRMAAKSSSVTVLLLCFWLYTEALEQRAGMDSCSMAYRSLHRCSQRHRRYLELASKTASTPLQFMMKNMLMTRWAIAESLQLTCLPPVSGQSLHCMAALLLSPRSLMCTVVPEGIGQLS